MRTRSSRLMRILFPGCVLLFHSVSGSGGVSDQKASKSTAVITKASIADITTGRFENQRVTFTGTVRHCVPQEPGPGEKDGLLKLSVAFAGQSLVVFGHRPPSFDLSRIIDSTVAVRGLASSYRNRKGQILSSFITADQPGDLQVLRPGPADPFQQTLQPIGQISKGVDRRRGDHRIRTRGVVTYYRPGRDLNIQDRDSAVLVQTTAKTRIRLGDLVDVVGFEATNTSSPHLEDGIVKVVSDHAVQPEPLKTNLVQVVADELDGRLIQVKGTVFDMVQRQDELLIVLQDGKNMIGAYLPCVYRGYPAGLEPGAKVELTGVALLIFDENQKPRSLSLRLRNTGDARVLQSAPWWTAKRALTLLAGATSVILIIAFWVFLLRKRVSAQTRLIRATLDGTADAILVLDNEQRYVDANEKFWSLWNLNRDECNDAAAILDRLNSLLVDGDVLRQLLSRPRHQGQASKLLTLQTSATFECDYEPIQGSSTGGVVLSFRDITSRRKSEMLERDRNQILEAISREDSLDVILPKVCRLAERQAPAIRCTIRLADAENGVVEYADVLGPELLDAAGTELTSHPLVSSANKELGSLLIARATGAPMTPNLPEVIAAASQLASIAIEHRRLFSELDYLAYHDALTGLLNRGALDLELNRMIEKAGRTQETFALLCIDLDRFKQINDTLSHRTGDLFICAVAQRLTDFVRAYQAQVFRVGGDEFIILLPSGSSLDQAEQMAWLLLDGLRHPFAIGDRSLHTTASIGIGLYPVHGETPAALQQAADSAMYKAKHGGKDQYKVFLAEWRVQEDGSFEMETLLRQAIESSWFEIHYQPKLTKARRICGLEALIRLRHPQAGLIPPDRFIAVAEDSGLIQQIGAWALDEVCSQIVRWRARGVSTCRVAVNVSAAQFARGDFFKTVTETLAKWNLAGDVLELELTESLLMKNITEATQLMKRLRDIGVLFAIDDFGTGYSSLGYLHALPVTALKIDRSFVRALHEPETSEALVKTILQLAKSLGLQVIAEGVETEEQFRLLQAMECDQFQGFLFSRPQPADQIERLFIQFDTDTPSSRPPSPAPQLTIRKGAEFDLALLATSLSMS